MTDYSQSAILRTAKRCPDCGGLVIPPCLECEIERKKAARRLKLASEAVKRVLPQEKIIPTHPDAY